MTIPPLYGTPTEWFEQLADLAKEGRKNGFPLNELSMGMSNDYALALDKGSTMLRIGSSIFGSRA
mgnify:CR=1 FL=1